MLTQPSPSSQSKPGAFRRFFMTGGRLGLPLSDMSDQTLTFFLACAIRNLLAAPNQRALDNVAELTAEARKRNLSAPNWPAMLIDALQRPEL